MPDRPKHRGPRRPAAAPAPAARPSHEDPRAYRGPGFRDAPTWDYQIDYAGLPKDEEEDAGAPPPANALPSAVLTSHESQRRGGGGSPRGMGGRRPDRQGTDPNAYRSPGFSERRDARFRGHPMTRGDMATPPEPEATEEVAAPEPPKPSGD